MGNQALNDIFLKIIEKDVPSRYLLRLGMGEEELDIEQSYSRVGRINAMLKRRLELLAEVERLAKVQGIADADTQAYTCETAGYFWILHLLSKWEKFNMQLERTRNNMNDDSLNDFKSSVYYWFP